MFRSLFLFLGIFSLFFSSSYASCSFENSNLTQCPRYYTGLGDISLSFGENIDLVSKSTLSIQNENSRWTNLNEEVSNSNFELENALVKSGVYDLNVKSYDDVDQLLAQKSFELVVDLNQPTPPQIPLIIESSQVSGFGDHSGDTIEARDYNNNLIATTSVNNDKSFNLNLNGYGGYLKFIAVSQNGLNSEPVERYVYSQERPNFSYENLDSTISLNLEVINLVNKVYNSQTYKRNFYIEGSTQAQDGTIVYVNGQRIPVISNKFGAFVELNVGVNQIEVVDRNGEGEIYEIEYLDQSFRFNSFYYQKVFSGDFFSISGSTTIPGEFLIYVDGVYKSSYETSFENLDFLINVNGVTKKRSVVELYGSNGEYREFIVYRDSQNPEISNLNFNNVGFANNLVFEIKDDIGLDLSSIKLNINSIDLDYSSRYGNYYIFDISNLDDGNYQYSLSAEDYLGNSINLDGRVNINSNFGDFGEFSSNEIVFLGDIIFVSEDEASFQAKLSQPISFKHIYVDDIDHTNYTLNSGLNLDVQSLEFSDDSGKVEFIYQDGSGNEFTKEYTYYVIESSPKVKLDSLTNYVRSSDVGLKKYVRLSGRVQSEIFNVGSFTINNNLVSNVFGDNYFEAFVNVEDGSFDFAGSDIFGRGMASLNLQNNLDEDSNDFTSNLGEGVNFYVGDIFNDYLGEEELVSLENSNFKRTNLNNNFIYSAEQREGISVFNLIGRNSLSHRNSEIQYLLTLDSTKPQYIFEQDEGFNYLHLDSSYSFLASYDILSEGESIKENLDTGCVSKFSLGYCFIIPQDQVELVAQDAFGNVVDETIVVENFGMSISNFEKVYFNGNDFRVESKENYIQGSVVSNKLIESISVESLDRAYESYTCDFDGVNFICLIDSAIGLNTYNLILNYVEIEDETQVDDGSGDSGGDDDEGEDVEFEVIRDEEDDDDDQSGGNENPGTGDNQNSLDINSRLISGAYNFGGDYFYFGDELSFGIDLTQNAVVEIYINGESRILGEYLEGENIYNIDLSSYIIDSTQKAELEIAFRAENDEDISESTPIILIYEKLKKLFVDILIE